MKFLGARNDTPQKCSPLKYFSFWHFYTAIFDKKNGNFCGIQSANIFLTTKFLNCIKNDSKNIFSIKKQLFFSLTLH